MRRKVLLRIAEYIVTLWVILTLNFVLPRLMPGDPFLSLSSVEEGEEQIVLTDEQRQYFLHYYGLDRPLLEQYGCYLLGLLKGDLGWSIYYRAEVGKVILGRLPWTCLLVIGATLLSTIIGILLGTLSARHREKALDKLLLAFLVCFAEVPSFLLGLSLLLLFAVGLGWFPLAGAVTPFKQYSGWHEAVIDVLHHAFLPLLTLTLTRLTGVYLLTRSTLLLVMTKDYIRTAKAKGIGQRLLWYRHALRNALLPVITRIGLQIGALLGGTVLVENVFAYPGMGTLLQEAVRAHDYPLLQGTFLVMAVGVLTANALADFVCRRLDPRLHYSLGG